jgi:hypothetical protein
MSFLYNPLLVAPSQLFQVIRKSQVNIEERRGIYLGEKEGGGWGEPCRVYNNTEEGECVREKLNEHPRGFKSSTYRVYILSHTYFPNTRPIIVRQEED